MTIGTSFETSDNIVIDIEEIVSKLSVGEMSTVDLRETCLNVYKQHAIQITMKDVEEAEDVCIKWGSKSKGKEFRKDFMNNYVVDRFELNT